MDEMKHKGDGDGSHDGSGVGIRWIRTGAERLERRIYRFELSVKVEMCACISQGVHDDTRPSAFPLKSGCAEEIKLPRVG